MAACALKVYRRWAVWLIFAAILVLASPLRGDAATTVLGSIAILGPCPQCYSASVSVTGTTSTALSPVPGSGLYAYVTSLSCFDTGSSATTVTIQNGSGGTTLWFGNLAATTGGFVLNNPGFGGDTTLGGGMTVATAIYFKAGTATTSLTCNIAGYMAQ